MGVAPAFLRGLAVEFADDLVQIDCPACGRFLPYRIDVPYKPQFVPHQGCPRQARLCIYRHPVHRQVVVRVIPADIPWPEYHKLVVQELRAVAGKAGLL